MDKSIIKNMVSLFLVQGVGYILPLITLPYLVRVLGPGGFGALGFSLAFTQYFILLTQYGFDLSATNKIAIHKDDKEKVSEIFWGVLICKTLLAILSAIIILISIFFVPVVSEYKYIIIASFSSVVGSVFLPTWLFQGKEKMGWMAMYNIVARALTIPLIFLCVNSSKDIWLAALISGCGIMLASVISLTMIYRIKWVKWSCPRVEQLKEIMYDGWHIFLSNIAGSLYINSIPVLLGFIVGPVLVGYYVAADRIRQAIQGLMGPVTQVFYPRVSALMIINKDKAFKMIRWLLSLQSLIALIVSLLVCFFAERIILLFYSSAYTESITILRLLAPLLFVISVSNVLGVQGMLTMGMRKSFSGIVWVGAILNTILIFPLIYSYGINGAAMSVLVTEVIIMILIINKTKKVWRNPW